MADHYDAIVIGTGGVGSAALFHLATRGLQVLGIDRFPPGHNRGSSHGETRAIRKAYFEHPDYVPLLHRAYELWRSLQESCGEPLLFTPGLLEIGPPQGILLQGLRAAVAKHALPLEDVDRSQFAKRFPGFVLPDGHEAVFEPEGGYLLVEKCVRASCELAETHGARLAIGESVKTWSAAQKHIEVKTQRQTYRAERLVIAGGAWSADLLQSLGIGFRVVRKHLHWYSVENHCYASTSGSPVFFYETPQGYYYGFPQIETGAIKVAEHSGGELVSDPLELSRQPDPEERKRVEAFLCNYLPQVSRQTVRHDVCMYTLTADEHFVIDRHPGLDNVAFAAGLSGHGFKFASALGEVLADLVVDGRTPLALDFLSCRRRSLQDAT